jgi:hypothetical protein
MICSVFCFKLEGVNMTKVFQAPSVKRRMKEHHGRERSASNFTHGTIQYFILIINKYFKVCFGIGVIEVTQTCIGNLADV